MIPLKRCNGSDERCGAWPRCRGVGAAEHGRDVVVSALLAAGAEVNKAKDGRETALILAARAGHATVVSALLAAGAEVDTAKAYEVTALMLAADHGRDAVVSALLAAGAKVNQVDYDGWTALMHAADTGHAVVVSLLLAAGAEVDKADADGETALMRAADRGHAVVASLLLAAGAEVAQVDANGWTALMHASAWMGHDGGVSALLVAGADVGVTAAAGQAAFFAAAVNSGLVTFNLLLAHPRIHSCVAAAEAMLFGQPDAEEEDVWETDDEEDEDDDYALFPSVRASLRRWHLHQALCAAARAPAVVEASSLPPALADALEKVKRVANFSRGALPCSSELLDALAQTAAAGLDAAGPSRARDADGFTALGGAASAGASKAVVVALVAAGCSVTVPGDLAGASVGALAARAGQRPAADWLYRAATKEVARTQPLFRKVRSMLVVGTSGARAGRPFLPIDVLNKVMDCCATPDACWFAQSHPPPTPPPLPVPVPVGGAAAFATGHLEAGGWSRPGQALAE
jgi:ankyrin repeat protein